MGEGARKPGEAREDAEKGMDLEELCERTGVTLAECGCGGGGKAHHPKVSCFSHGHSRTLSIGDKVMGLTLESYTDTGLEKQDKTSRSH